jgi:hypothetical protein
VLLRSDALRLAAFPWRRISSPYSCYQMLVSSHGRSLDSHGVRASGKRERHGRGLAIEHVGECEEHTRASPRGRRREQAPALHTRRLFVWGGWCRSRQVSLPATMYRAPTKKKCRRKGANLEIGVHSELPVPNEFDPPLDHRFDPAIGYEPHHGNRYV